MIKNETSPDFILPEVGTVSLILCHKGHQLDLSGVCWC